MEPDTTAPQEVTISLPFSTPAWLIPGVTIFVSKKGALTFDGQKLTFKADDGSREFSYAAADLRSVSFYKGYMIILPKAGKKVRMTLINPDSSLRSLTLGMMVGVVLAVLGNRTMKKAIDSAQQQFDAGINTTIYWQQVLKASSKVPLKGDAASNKREIIIVVVIVVIVVIGFAILAYSMDVTQRQ